MSPVLVRAALYLLVAVTYVQAGKQAVRTVGRLPSPPLGWLDGRRRRLENSGHGFGLGQTSGGSDLAVRPCLARPGLHLARPCPWRFGAAMPSVTCVARNWATVVRLSAAMARSGSWALGPAASMKDSASRASITTGGGTNHRAETKRLSRCFRIHACKER
jgi:hypothetical protein